MDHRELLFRELNLLNTLEEKIAYCLNHLENNRNDYEIIFRTGDYMCQQAFDSGKLVRPAELKKGKFMLQYVADAVNNVDENLKKIARRYISKVSVILAENESNQQEKIDLYEESVDEDNSRIWLSSLKFIDEDIDKAKELMLRSLREGQVSEKHYLVPFTVEFLADMKVRLLPTLQNYVDYLSEQPECYWANRLIAGQLAKNNCFDKALHTLEKSYQQALQFRESLTNEKKRIKVDGHIGQIRKEMMAVGREAIRRQSDFQSDYCEVLLKYSPEEADLLIYMGKVRMLEKEFAEAADYYNRAFTLVTNNPQEEYDSAFPVTERAALLFCNYKTGNWEQARKIVEKARNPEHPLTEIVCQLGKRHAKFNLSSRRARIAYFRMSDPLRIRTSNPMYQLIKDEIKILTKGK